MTQVNVNASQPAAAASDIVVRRPRESDALGSALRHVFAPERMVPDEWSLALDALDDAGDVRPGCGRPISGRG